MGPPRAKIILLLLGTLLVTSVAVAEGGYTLSASPSIDIPDQTATYEGTEYTIGTITRVFAGDSVSVETTVPNNATHTINFRGPENELISSTSKTGDSTHTIEYFGAGEAGTYAITIKDNNEIQSVQPVVLAGYDISVDSPSSVDAGDSVTITADVTARSIEKHSSLDYVEVVIGSEDVQARQEMAKQSGGTYETTISTDNIDEGTYDVYVNVRGDAEVRQRSEVLAMSDQQSLTITSQSTESSGSDDSGSGSGSGAGSATQPSDPVTESTSTPQTATATVTPSSTETHSATPRTTQTITPASETEETTRLNTQTQSGADSQTSQSSEDESGVLEPSTQEPPSTTASSGPGFTIGAGLLAVVLAVLLSRLRN